MLKIFISELAQRDLFGNWENFPRILYQNVDYRHFCECGPGFRAYQDPLQDGHTICVDVDECELGKATCHQSTKCWNTQGSYQCYCQHGNQTHCSKGTKKYNFWYFLHKNSY